MYVIFFYPLAVRKDVFYADFYFRKDAAKMNGFSLNGFFNESGFIINLKSTKKGVRELTPL